MLVAGSAGAGDRGADGRFEKRASSHFVLYQDVDIDESGGLRGSRRFEQQVLDELERAYERLDQWLGLRPSQRIDVVIYDAGLFDARFAGRFRFAAAGFYNGVICVRGDTLVTTALARVLHHELVHAALADAAPSLILPAWLNEGVAEWFEARAVGKRNLAPGEIAALRRARAAGGLIAIGDLNRSSFAGFGQGEAQLAYLQSYAMVEYLSRSFGERSLGEFLEAVLRQRSIDAALQRTYRLSLPELEARFAAELA